jgi:hypothetical protein
LFYFGRVKSETIHLEILSCRSGVHSTVTTIESGDQASDIPVSSEAFSDMKNRGEFLATSHILGRVCGFATSQVHSRRILNKLFSWRSFNVTVTF